MSYTAGEVAAKLGLSKDGLRYYEKEGLIPPIARDKSGHRAYSESDVDWIFLIRCLRDTDMPIFKIKQYVSLAMESGDNSIIERRKMLKEHEAVLDEKIKTFQKLQKLIEKKVEFFDDTLKADDQEAIRCMDYIEEWEKFKVFLGGFKRD
ncbi:MAG: MerR family transcriptional regulator [Defluviitaleaceae bacterium]|nr:MerR family transcriptional regulator [Defluviitaleaceae bacterium]